MEQLNGISPLLVLSWIFKLINKQNFLSHMEQSNGFSPLWVLSWMFKLIDNSNWKFSSHMEQCNGISPLWVLSWIFKLIAKWTFLTHMEQLNGFLPLWVFSWSLKLWQLKMFITLGTIEWFLTVSSFMDHQTQWKMEILHHDWNNWKVSHLCEFFLVPHTQWQMEIVIIFRTVRRFRTIKSSFLHLRDKWKFSSLPSASHQIWIFKIIWLQVYCS